MEFLAGKVLLKQPRRATTTARARLVHKGAVIHPTAPFYEVWVVLQLKRLPRVKDIYRTAATYYTAEYETFPLEVI